MSYALYFIGGPIDLTKKTVEGRQPANWRVRVPEYEPLTCPPDYAADLPATGPNPRIHDYLIFPLPEEPNSNMLTFVAIWQGIKP